MTVGVVYLLSLGKTKEDWGVVQHTEKVVQNNEQNKKRKLEKSASGQLQNLLKTIVEKKAEPSTSEVALLSVVKEMQEQRAKVVYRGSGLGGCGKNSCMPWSVEKGR
mmetsp:Transcript_19763/g.27256  ORF Transcript_19763/g.27256 Transcript_19763/m.27256 type:complete len:107 (+) Transcript_19763:161-481(+)